MPYPYTMPYQLQNNFSTALPFPNAQYPQMGQQNQTGLIVAWVQGEQAMKSYPLGPNQKAFLFNTEENNFGIKSTDANGMPLPLEVFEYQRVQGAPKPQSQQAPQIDTSSFITREEFESRMSKVITEFESKNNQKRESQQNRGEQKYGK